MFSVSFCIFSYIILLSLSYFNLNSIINNGLMAQFGYYLSMNVAGGLSMKDVILPVSFSHKVVNALASISMTNGWTRTCGINSVSQVSFSIYNDASSLRVTDLYTWLAIGY